MAMEKQELEEQSPEMESHGAGGSGMNPEEMRAREEFFYEEQLQKPPLGLKPKWLWDAIRARDIQEATVRYFNAEHLKIPIEWIEEYNEIIRRYQKT